MVGMAQHVAWCELSLHMQVEGRGGRLAASLIMLMYSTQDLGCSIQDPGYCTQDSGVVHRIRDAVHRILGVGS